MKANQLILGLLLVIMVSMLNACKLLYPNRMFKQGNYEYFKSESNKIDDYVIQPGDLLTVRIFARDGFDLLDVLNNNQGNNNQQNLNNNAQRYLVDLNGYVELPIFGEIYVKGIKERDLEKSLEAKSGELFNDPFVEIRVVNRRVFLFKGSDGQVVSLNEAPTSLIEVLAKSGGLKNNLKAYKIKIIRGELENPEIINIDLSKLTGIRDGEIIMQNNDIIYIEERLRVASTLLRELSSILALVSAITSILVLSKRF